MTTATATPINTKQVTGRRDIEYKCLDCLRADLDKIQAAHDAGTLRALGNWSPGQILQHCGKFMGFALDGFPPGKVPWFIRVPAKLFIKKRAIRGDPPPPGIRLPEQASFLLPDDDVSFEQGMSEMRTELLRLEQGEKMTKPSPLLGELDHDQWVRLQLGHCKLHLSFLKLE